MLIRTPPLMQLQNRGGPVVQNRQRSLYIRAGFSHFVQILGDFDLELIPQELGSGHKAPAMPEIESYASIKTAVKNASMVVSAGREVLRRNETQACANHPETRTTTHHKKYTNPRID